MGIELSIKMEDFTAYWKKIEGTSDLEITEKYNKPVLYDINIAIKKGSLTCIIGKVGKKHIINLEFFRK